MHGQGRRVIAVGVLLGWALAGCKGGQDIAETPQPAMVVHPAGDAQAALAAYAGEVRARQESPLSFRVGGNLIRRNMDTGARVRRGEVLAELDAGDFGLQEQAARAELAAAQAELARTRQDKQRYEKLVDQALISRSAYDAQLAAYQSAEGRVRAARAQMEVMHNQATYSQLRAPRDGVIASRLVEAGQVVAAGQTIYTLAADGGREVVIAIPENRIREVRVGQPAQVELWSAPGQQLAGMVREITPMADAQTRTYAARVSLVGEAAQAVELGQSARVYVQQQGEPAALKLPLSAVQRSAQGGSAVWVVDPKTRQVISRSVRLGAYGDTEVPVLSGVSAADWVVAGGGHLLREGQVVMPVDRDNRPVLAAVSAVPHKEARP